MRSGLRTPALALAIVLALLPAAHALDGASLVCLKRAGVSDATIEVLVRERAIETAAFSVDEILAMKAAGVSEKTMQAVVAAGSFMQDREPVVYGTDLKSVSLSTPADLIALKQAGVSDEVLQAIVLASRGGSEVERQQALEVLRNSGIWVDARRDRIAP
jgi:hypothetical protein